MGTHRTWDETMSPQWKYLHQQESARKRGGRKTAARLRREREKLEETESMKYTVRDPAFKSVKKKKEEYKRINKLLKEENQNKKKNNNNEDVSE